MPGSLSDAAEDSFSDLLSDWGDFNSPIGNSRIHSDSPPALDASETGPEHLNEWRDFILNLDDPGADGSSQLDGSYEWASPRATQLHMEETLDDDMIPHVPADEQAVEPAWDPSVQRIEAMVVDFLEQLSAAMPSTEGEVQGILKKKTRNLKKLELRLTNRTRLSNDGRTFGTRVQIFPRGLGASIVPFDLAHEALIDGLPATKRDLYYKDVTLFKKQSVVDKLVDDLAATIDTGRAHLNIRASPKGLIWGAGLSMHTVGGNVIRITESEGTLIPVTEDIVSLDLSNNVRWILIVEKEAVFQTLRQLCLIRHPFWRAGPGIMITGKGYPDLATRQLVKVLSDNVPPTVPVVALVDGDAYGLDIVSVYKFGSVALHHEASKLAAPRVECIGIWTSELASFGIDKDALIPISRADERKARSMLRRELPARWKRELMHMLYTRRKAEMEILSSVPRCPDGPHPLVRYLANRIEERIATLAQEHRSASGLRTNSDYDGDNDGFFDELGPC